MWYLTDKTFLDNYCWAKIDFSKEEMQNLKNLFNNPDNIHRGKVFNEDAPEEELNKIRRSDVVWIDHEFAQKNNLMETVYKFYDQATFLNEKFFQFEITHGESIQLTRYKSTEGGFYNTHADVPRDAWVDCRKLSIVIQLSDPDEYEGGEFVFNGRKLIDEIPHLKEAGSVIMFPSYCQHSVLPVTKGTRYSLVNWLRGPKFK